MNENSITPIYRMDGEVDGHPFVQLYAGTQGCCEVGLARETAGIRRLWVDPSARRTGLGRALFAQAVKIAEEAGKLALSWQVKKDNSAALLFYMAVGGVIVHDDGDGYYWMAVPLMERGKA